MISETNSEIESLVSHLDSKIIEFRKKYPRKTKTLEDIKIYYDRVVISWMENYLLTRAEVPNKYDESVKNDILDLINILNVFLK